MVIESPEVSARVLLEHIGGSQPPVDLNSLIASIDGLTISRLDLDNAGYLVDLGPRGAEIFVRRTDPEPRIRFTMAHELGHWMLNRQIGSNDVEFRGLVESEVERWCDRFAANILMPQEWIAVDVSGLSDGELVSYLFKGPTIYDVSRQAFYMRLSELFPVGIFEVSRTMRSVSVIRKFQSANTDRVRMSEPLKKAMLAVRRSGSMEGTIANSDALVTTYRMLRGSRDSSVWIICIEDRHEITSIFRDLARE